MFPCSSLIDSLCYDFIFSLKKMSKRNNYNNQRGVLDLFSTERKAEGNVEDCDKSGNDLSVAKNEKK